VEDDDFYYPARMLNQQMKYLDRMFDEYMPSRFQRLLHRPWWIREYAMRPEKDIKVEYDNKKFEIKLDIGEYSSEDLNVKITGDRLIISGKHQEKQDKYGSVSREFTRHFVIPENVDAESIESSYNGEELVLRGKVKGSENIKERVVEIKQHPKEQAKKEG